MATTMTTTMTATMTATQDEVQDANRRMLTQLRKFGVPVQPFPARTRTPITLHFGGAVGAVQLTVSEVK